MLAFLRVVADPARVPVFVHCSHGADRTGAMTAAYRVVVQGWDKEEAIREMIQGGFGYHTLWDNLPATIRKLDVPALKPRGQAMGSRARKWSCTRSPQTTTRLRQSSSRCLCPP